MADPHREAVPRPPEELHYDEFSLFHENAEEAGLPWLGPPVVRRERVDLPGGRHASALVWGEAAPELVLVHGGGQNAHTWDTVALAMGRPLVAVDLAGHGHSAWPAEAHVLSLEVLAADLAAVMEALAPGASTLVGMSLGGLTSIVVAHDRPELVERLLLVDITPGVDAGKGAAIAAFLNGPESFESFEEMLERTVAFNPTRSHRSLRRGVLHNSVPLGNGRWAWRHQLGRSGGTGIHVESIRFERLWDDLSAIAAPRLLAKGTESPVVDEADVAEFERRAGAGSVVRVEGAGHSIQGDRPLELAEIIRRFAGGGPA